MKTIHYLWVIKKDTCQVFPYATLHDKKLHFTYENKKYALKEDQTLCVQSVYFYHEAKPRLWSWIALPDRFEFGRNNLQMDNKIISTQQFIIQNHHLIHTGKNTTFVNGKSVFSCKLGQLDEILIFGCIFYYFEGWLLCSQAVKDAKPITYAPPKFWPKTGKVHEWKNPEFEMIELEIFKTINDQPSASLFQTISTSSMMLISTLVGTGIQIHMQPARIQEIVWMSITSFTMALTYIGLGCMNRTIQNKNQKKQRAKEENQYKQYVDQMLLQAQKQIQIHNQQFELEKKQWDSFHALVFEDDSFLIPIHICKEQTSCLRLPHISYEQKCSSLYPYVQEAEKKSYMECWYWEYFQPHQKVWIRTNNYTDLFIRFAWQKTTWKWIWIGPVQEELTWHACCMEDKKRLWIQNLDDFSLFHSLKHKNYIVCCVEPQYLEWIPSQYKETLIFCSTFSCNETFDFVYDHLDLRPLSIQSLRLPPAQKKEVRLGWNYTFHVEDLYTLSLKTIRANQTRLIIPIGFLNRQMIELDLRDAHGLVAGTTGSGKSEFLTSLLFQLCVRYDASQVQYILVDFKGGAFSASFENFPHCGGMLTNLESGEMDRFQISLQSEIEQRQKKIAQFLKKYPSKTAHIDTYNAYEPCMSHVFIVIDEFAQLKTQCPDFLQYLKEIARIGRSLGIHLILATQKPSGVVDEQIWSNSKFRICFRVQTPMDSREVLMHEKASLFESPGQFCLQYENQETYGTSLYTQEEVNFENQKKWSYVHGSKAEKLSCKVAEYLSQLIGRDFHHQRWIIQPTLTNQEVKELGRIDVCQEQIQKPFSLEYGQSCLILMTKKEARKKWLTMIENEYEDVYIWNQHVNSSSYWQMLQESSNKTLVLSDIEYASVFQKENIRLFILVNHLHQESPLSFTYKIASSWQDMESVQNIFHLYHVKKQNYPYAWLQENEELVWMKWRTNNIKKNISHIQYKKYISISSVFTKELYLETFTQFVVGYEKNTYIPIVCDSEKTWTILYKDPAVAEELKVILQLWKFKMPPLQIAWNSMNQNATIWAGSIDKMKNLPFPNQNIVWLGSGSSEYTHILKKQMLFEETNLIIWQDAKVIKGERIKIRYE